jgi:hypothetical protein
MVMGVNYPDGHTAWKARFNAFGPTDVDPRAFPLLTLKKIVPTCVAMPSWASRMDSTYFGNDEFSDRAKAQYRAKEAMSDKNWPEAEKQLKEELRLIREAEVKGYGSYSRSDALDALDKVHTVKLP